MKTKISRVAAGRLRNAPVAGEPQHFHPKGKLPSKYTIKAQHRLRKMLPFAHKRDFEEAKRGFLPPHPSNRLPQRPASLTLRIIGTPSIGSEGSWPSSPLTSK